MGGPGREDEGEDNRGVGRTLWFNHLPTRYGYRTKVQEGSTGKQHGI